MTVGLDHKSVSHFTQSAFFSIFLALIWLYEIKCKATYQQQGVKLQQELLGKLADRMVNACGVFLGQNSFPAPQPLSSTSSLNKTKYGTARTSELHTTAFTAQKACSLFSPTATL